MAARGPSACIHLKRWYLVSLGRTALGEQLLAVEGARVHDPDSGDPSISTKHWTSSAVVERISATKLASVSGSVYVLDGPCKATSQGWPGISDDVHQAFSHGFPETWKDYLHPAVSSTCASVEPPCPSVAGVSRPALLVGAGAAPPSAVNTGPTLSVGGGIPPAPLVGESAEIDGESAEIAPPVGTGADPTRPPIEPAPSPSKLISDHTDLVSSLTVDSKRSMPAATKSSDGVALEPDALRDLIRSEIQASVLESETRLLAALTAKMEHGADGSTHGSSLRPSGCVPRISSDEALRRRSSAAAYEAMTSEKDRMWALVKDDTAVLDLLDKTRQQIDIFTTRKLRREQEHELKETSKRKLEEESTSSTYSNRGTRRKLLARVLVSSASKLTATLQTRSTAFGKVASRIQRKGACKFFCGDVIHPDSKFRAVWNVLLAVFIIYCGIQVPLEIAFEQDMVGAMCGVGDARTLRADCVGFQLWFWFNMVIDMWFIADIVVNCRTGYVVEGHLVDDDWKTLKHYLKSSFTMDAMGSFPLNLVLIAVNPDNPYGEVLDEDSEAGTDVGRMNRMLRMMRMTKLTKLTRMFKLARYIEGAEAIINPGLLGVIKLVMISLLCCHWFGCMWWLICDLEINEPDLLGPAREHSVENNWHPPSWLKESNDLATKYLFAFFWGAGVVTSLVPKDIEPITALESIATTFAMFVGLLLNAYVISSLTAALASMNSKKELAGKQLEAIKQYCMIKGVQADLRSRILEYYEYVFTSSAALAEMDMFSQMPPALNAQLSLSVGRRLVARCSFFRDVTNASLIMLISAMAPFVFVPGQVIVLQRQRLRAVYFINRGLVQLFTETRRVGDQNTIEAQLGHMLVRKKVKPKDLVLLWDKEKKGSVNEFEFQQGVRDLGINANNEELSALFASYDEDGGGTLDTAELKDALRRLQDQAAMRDVGTEEIAILKEWDNFGFEDYMEAQTEDEPERAAARHSARALTYCDVMSLSIDKLTEELETDQTFQNHKRLMMHKKKEKARNILCKLQNQCAGDEGAQPSALQSALKMASAAQPGRKATIRWAKLRECTSRSSRTSMSERSEPMSERVSTDDKAFQA